MFIEIELKKEAYTPEAFAYRDYLQSRGWEVRLCLASSMSKEADVQLYFMGMRPLWRVGLQEPRKVIHEYQSLSVPPFSKVKDSVKKVFNSVPHGRIFLNCSVRSGLSFSDGVPYILRDMGVSENLYISERKGEPDYDVLYCGTLANRKGLVEELVRLSGLGLSVLVVGSVPDDIFHYLKGFAGISLTGRVERKGLPAVFRSARAGLNFTPNLYPFNIQTSTKTLEYCASGLGLISNRYPWIESFCRENGFEPLWLDDIRDRADFDDFNFPKVDVGRLSWSNILDRSGFLSFLNDVVNC